MAIPSPDVLISASLVLVALVWMRRAFVMGALARRNPPILPLTGGASAGKVSVIVPARDEEKNIGRCLTSLMKQHCGNYEIVVVDDRSADRTGHLVENLSKLSPVPVKLVRVEKLPDGWTGKNHAMVVGSKAASGDWFLFTDADTTHGPHSVQSALGTAAGKNVDFLTLAPHVECRTFWENTVQPLAVSSLALWFKAHELGTPGSKAVIANGQFILVKRKAYEAVGGNECVKSEVIEDVELAKKVKAAGFNVEFLNGTKLYSTRMYTSLAQIVKGWTRIFTHLFEKNALAIAHKIFLFAFFSIYPFAVIGAEKWLLFTGSPEFSPLVFWTASASTAWIVFLRFTSTAMLRANPWYAFLHPLGSLVMVWILLKCLGRIFFNRRSEWRGDRY